MDRGLKVKFIGKDDPLALRNGKVYEVEAVDPKTGWYAIIDETHEEYAYSPKLFEIVEQ